MNAGIVDQSVREEAIQPTQSFIVQAPAGSGKTGLLTQRLLALLAEVEAPEECLAITFTRKAASEMRDRILAALQQAQEDKAPVDPYHLKIWGLARQALRRDAALEWNLLENPNRLAIKTMDAFCASLTHQMPILSRLGAVPRITEAADKLYEVAAGYLLQALETEEPWSESVRTLLEHLDNNLALAKRLLAGMLSHRDQWLPYIGATLSAKESRVLLERGLQAALEETLKLLAESAPQSIDMIDVFRFAAQQLHRLGFGSAIQQCQGLRDNWPGHHPDELSVWQGVGELLLTQEHRLRKTVTEKQGFPSPTAAKNPSDKRLFKAMKARMTHGLEAISDHPEFLENLRQLRECPHAVYDDRQWVVVNALVQLMPVLVAELSLVFQERGEVDFIEISLAALKALGEEEAPTDLALGLDYKIRHILVDEFQDTSLSHFRLLEKLTVGWQPNDGRTVFLVGDPMQSIYRFRQADVGLFIAVQQKGMGGIMLKPLLLQANFRSDPTLVEWTNHVFKMQFPLKDDITSGAIAFHPSKATQCADKYARVIHQAVTLETEPAYVVEALKTVQAEAPLDSKALLVRSRHHLQAILPELRNAGIAYQGIEIDLLQERPIVRDLLALTRALLHLGDRIAWLAIFRTPWARLSLDDLWVLSQHQPELPLWHTVRSYTTVANLSAAGQTLLAKLVPILSNTLFEAYRFSLRAWVEESWTALGGPQYLYSHASIADAEAFFALLEEVDQTVEWDITVLEKRVQSLYAKPMQAVVNALQIMTIHKAKGLEFDVVMVAGVGRKTMPVTSQLLLWEERVSSLKAQKRYLIMAPIAAVGGEPDRIYQYLKKQEEKRQAYESIRLEYVAATRARKRLYWLTHQPIEE